RPAQDEREPERATGGTTAPYDASTGQGRPSHYQKDKWLEPTSGKAQVKRRPSLNTQLTSRKSSSGTCRTRPKCGQSIPKGKRGNQTQQGKEFLRDPRDRASNRRRPVLGLTSG